MDNISTQIVSDIQGVIESFYEIYDTSVRNGDIDDNMIAHSVDNGLFYIEYLRDFCGSLPIGLVQMLEEMDYKKSNFSHAELFEIIRSYSASKIFYVSHPSYFTEIPLVNFAQVLFSYSDRSNFLALLKSYNRSCPILIPEVPAHNVSRKYLGAGHPGYREDVIVPGSFLHTVCANYLVHSFGFEMGLEISQIKHDKFPAGREFNFEVNNYISEKLSSEYAQCKHE